jgi:hypothetical protein
MHMFTGLLQVKRIIKTEEELFAQPQPLTPFIKQKS